MIKKAQIIAICCLVTMVLGAVALTLKLNSPNATADPVNSSSCDYEDTEATEVLVKRQNDDDVLKNQDEYDSYVCSISCFDVADITVHPTVKEPSVKEEAVVEVISTVYAAAVEPTFEIKSEEVVNEVEAEEVQVQATEAVVDVVKSVEPTGEQVINVQYSNDTTVEVVSDEYSTKSLVPILVTTDVYEDEVEYNVNCDEENLEENNYEEEGDIFTYVYGDYDEVIFDEEAGIVYMPAPEVNG